MNDNKMTAYAYSPEPVLIDTRFDMKLAKPYMVTPKVFNDARGSFSEVLVKGKCFSYMDEVKQINRSTSKPGVLRGFHAQTGDWCQAKLVEAVNAKLYDIIVDMRPTSSTFRKSASYVLDPVKQNKLFVPKGFLHAFFVPYDIEVDEAIFMYYCDNVYNKPSEIGADPKSVLPEVLTDPDNAELKACIEADNLSLSDKDTAGEDFNALAERMKNDPKMSMWWMPESFQLDKRVRNDGYDYPETSDDAFKSIMASVGIDVKKADE